MQIYNNFLCFEVCFVWYKSYSRFLLIIICMCMMYHFQLTIFQLVCLTIHINIVLKCLNLKLPLYCLFSACSLLFKFLNFFLHLSFIFLINFIDCYVFHYISFFIIIFSACSRVIIYILNFWCSVTVRVLPLELDHRKLTSIENALSHYIYFESSYILYLHAVKIL